MGYSPWGFTESDTTYVTEHTCTQRHIHTYRCVCVLVTQLCLTLCDPMDCGPPGFSIHGIFQAKRLEWVAISFSNAGM